MNRPRQEKHISVLIVDDRPETMSVLTEFLQDQGYRVRQTTSARAALRSVKSAPPDLILLNITAPQVNGYEICEQLKSDPQTAAIPILLIDEILIDEIGDDFDEIQAGQMGAEDFIAKPFEAKNVLAQISHRLRSQQSQQTLPLHKAPLALDSAQPSQKDLFDPSGESTATLQQETDRHSTAKLAGPTTIANRHHFDEVFQFEWKRCGRAGHALALILCDVDDFQSCDDRCGQSWRDRRLDEVAQLLSRLVRGPSDIVAHYGGAVFALLLPETNAASAVAVATRLRNQIHQPQIADEVSPNAPPLNLSFGIASKIPHLNCQQGVLFQAAERALLTAKSQGRDRIVLAK
jgi:diguanylate cyclase (GGDEF)-like protein